MPHAPWPSWRRVLGPVAAAAACLLALLTGASPASAHAVLLATDPVDGTVLAESPGTATFTFNEPVTLPPDGVQVFDAEGREVEATATAGGPELAVDVPDTLADGTYVVAWRIVSADGHPVAGSLAFSVGRPSVHVAARDVPTAGDGVRAALSVAHGLGYVGLLLALGLAVFLVVLLPTSGYADRPRARLRRLLTAGAVVSAAGVVAAVPLTVADQQGLGLVDALTVAGRTRAATDSVVAAALWVLALGLAVLAAVRAGTVRVARTALAAALLLGAVAPTLTGHTRTFGPRALVVAADVLHVLAGSVWLGGLVGLAVALPALGPRRAGAAVVLARFSTLAATVLAALVVTGTLLGWRIVGSWDRLVATAYGQLLLAKVALVLLAVGFATWNRFVLLPRARDADDVTRLPVFTRLGRVASGEALVLVAVAALTGFLVDQSPQGRQLVVPEGRTGVEVAQLGEDHKVLATLAPGRVGQNVLLVQLQDLTGEPFEPAHAPSLRLGSDDLDLGTVTAAPVDGGTLRATVVLPSRGEWRLQVSVRLDEFDNPVAVVPLDVG